MIRPRPTRLLLLACAGLAVTGCDRKTPDAPKPATVALVADAAKSPAFDATVKHLDVGGPVFCFADTEGDPKRVADALLRLYAMMAKQEPSVPKAPATLDPFLRDLGFDNIHATGFSGRRDGAAFVNRSFLYTPGGPAGLTTIFGAKNVAFTAPAMAPADTAFLAEFEIDGDRLLAVARAVAAHVDDGGKTATKLEKLLSSPLPDLPVTGAQLVSYLSGRTFVGVRFKDDALHLGSMTAPGAMFAVALEKREPLFRLLANLAQAAGQSVPVTRTTEDDLEILALRVPENPVAPDYAPLLALEKKTGRVWLATNRETLDAWLKPSGAKLATAPTFAKLSAGLAAQGTALVYVAPDADKPVRKLLEVGGNLAGAFMPAKERATVKDALAIYDEAIQAFFPKDGAGVYAVSFLAPDGLATEARAPISNKPNAYLWACDGGAAPVMGVGVMATLAVPAFKKARNSAIEKAIVNDARQISAAANQSFAESGKATCTVGELVGPNAFISSLSAGNRVGVTSGDRHPTYPELVAATSPEAKKLILRTGGRFVVGNPNYDRTLSSNPAVKNAAGTEHTIEFEVDTGAVAK